MTKDKDKKTEGKVNFFNIKVSPVVFFILDFVLIVGLLLLFDFIWSKVRNEEFRFGVIGNIILPLILAIVGTVTMINGEKKKK